MFTYRENRAVIDSFLLEARKVRVSCQQLQLICMKTEQEISAVQMLLFIYLQFNKNSVGVGVVSEQ